MAEAEMTKQLQHKTVHLKEAQRTCLPWRQCTLQRWSSERSCFELGCLRSACHRYNIHRVYHA